MKHLSATLLHTVVVISILYSEPTNAQGRVRKQLERQAWAAGEYSGSRSSKDLQSALASKGFAWLSGSPADNEKLSIGKNSQFFGFVALRYLSDRAANRGTLGRAFFAIANSSQRNLLANAVLAEEKPLKEWWETRKRILRLFEHHLYTGIPIDDAEVANLGGQFSTLGARVAITEARAFAALEDSLTRAQWAQISTWRENPETAGQERRQNRVTVPGLNRDQIKQVENLFAKAFSWFTGRPEDNEIIPLGQPAQFFGFVSIRHKSGHAASRGRIARSFLAILNSEQRSEINKAIAAQMPVVRRFLEKRHEFLEQLASLRAKSGGFNSKRAIDIAVAMGAYELEAGSIEATAYRRIRETMSDAQTSQMMQLRGDYVIDRTQVESLSLDQRGAQLAILCAGCHGAAGQHRSHMLGPTLDGIFDRPIASSLGFDYSQSLLRQGGGSGRWTPEKMDQFLAAPKRFAPGTKMEFQGLLNAEDRQALIRYLQQHR